MVKILITGSGGRLGAALMREYAKQFEVAGFNHSQLDLADLTGTAEAISRCEFDVLINAAAFTNVDLAEKETEQAFLVNAEAPRVLAAVCHDKGAKLIHFSTDYVFDGEKTEPYTEQDESRPISAYGASKLAGEKAVLSVSEDHLVVRVSWVFGPDRPSFIDQMIARAREHEAIAAVADKFSTPTYTKDIAEMLMSVIAPRTVVGGDGDPGSQTRGWNDGMTESGQNARGILHIANSGRCTWQQYAQHALDCCRAAGVPLKATHVGAVKMHDMTNWVARRPIHSVLETSKVAQMTGSAPRPWQDAVADYVRTFVAAG